MSANAVSPRARQFILSVDRFVFFLSRHWLSLTILFLALFAGLPFLAPLLEHAGWSAPAQGIYWVYSLTCHQLAYRSFFFFGDGNTYTIDQLQTALRTAQPASDLVYWRHFLGNPNLGYKMAWCARDTAMYVSLIVALLIFAAVRRHLKPLDPRLYLLFLLPIAMDGTWQLFTSPVQIAPFLPVHESTPELRVLSGVLFGVATVWLVFPRIEIAMRETLAQAEKQYERAQARN